MANLFIGIVKEKLTGATVHEHFSTNSDNTFYVEIWGEDPHKPLILGEFRKWHHLENLIKKEHPNLECISYNAGMISAEWLMNTLKYNI